jgi:heme/copper-type cytochrome/quinol oxidase subunit 4
VLLPPLAASIGFLLSVSMTAFKVSMVWSKRLSTAVAAGRSCGSAPLPPV